jgi:hypothetical protein
MVWPILAQALVPGWAEWVARQPQVNDHRTGDKFHAYSVTSINQSDQQRDLDR